ncbi:hypothetical protein OG216_36325 [Streptomycetaceae bacterium NBC_01309]
MALRLFVPGPIGMGDNGDGWRGMCALDITVEPDGEVLPTQHAAFFAYQRAEPRACDPDGVYPGSGRWLLWLAWPLSRLLGFSAYFDLRALAVLTCLSVGLAFAILAAALRGRRHVRVLVCLLVFVVVADSAFAGYAAAPYSELSGLTGILFAVAGAAHLGGTSGQRRWGLAVFLVGAVLAVSSKTQATSLALPFLGLLLVTKVPVRIPTGIRLGGARQVLVNRGLPLAAAVAIAGAGAVNLNSQVPIFKEINPTQVVFVHLLGKSQEPAAAARELGLPQDFARYAGQTWWSQNPPQADPRWSTVRDRMTYGNIAAFLAAHPRIAASIAVDAMEDFGEAYPAYLGSYPPDADQPLGAREHRVALYSATLRDLGGGVLVVVLAIGVAGIRWFRRTADNPRRQALVALIVCLAGVTAVQFVTAAYGDAVENTKHLVFAVFAAGLLFVLIPATLLCTPRDAAPAENPLPPPREGTSPPDDQSPMKAAARAR